MRKLVNQIFKTYFRARMTRIRRIMDRPEEVQQYWFDHLIKQGRETKWGQRYGYDSIHSFADYAERVPVQDYEGFKHHINRMMHGEENVLWPGRVKWFSKSSGTTADKSKFIPVPDDNLRLCHHQGTWDAMTCFYDQRPDARQFECRSLLVGGSLSPFEEFPATMRGDISAVMIHNMPRIALPFVTPDLETTLLSNFEEKLERMALVTSQERNLVMIGGVPTWTVVLFRRILEITGKSNLLEVWPDLQGYVHGGVSFVPYRQQFREFLPSPQVSYQEIYNASEGFFAIQNDFSSSDMLLLLDNGVYYEFLPLEEWDREYPKALTLEEVEIGKMYALIITTNAGLWRYKVGDTIEFTSLQPYKIRITGRTKQFINVFGEELMVENTDRALALACEAFDASVFEYTAAPRFFDGQQGRGGHEWAIEFERPPTDLDAFAAALDANLQKINSDYEAKRYKDMAMARLIIHAMPPGTFVNWMKSRGKFGGQNKVPRLANHRQFIEEILRFQSA